MFWALLLIFDGTEGAEPTFHILGSQTHFWWYRGRRAHFSCFALSGLLSAVPRAQCLIFMFCGPRLIFYGIEGVRSNFTLPDSFSMVSRAPSPVFMFCTLKLVFGGTEGVVPNFHVLRSETHFRRYRGRRVQFYALRLIFDGTEGTGPSFHVLRLRAHFRVHILYSTVFFTVVSSINLSHSKRSARILMLPGYCSNLHKICPIYTLKLLPTVEDVNSTFSAVLRASDPLFMVCTHRLVLAVLKALGPLFLFYAPGLIFSDTKGAEPTFHVLGSRTLFRRYRCHRIYFSCFTLPDSFLAVPRAPNPLLMLCAPELISDYTEGVSPTFHVLSSRTRFGRYLLRFYWVCN
jgi:hypothetical protein